MAFRLGDRHSTSKSTFSLIVVLALFGPLLTACSHRQASSSCGYPAEITVGNSAQSIGAGGCSGSFGSAGTAVHMKVGQTLTVHFESRAIASATSQYSKVLELTAENSLEQRYQALTPGVSKILYSPPIDTFLLCQRGFNQTMAGPCVIAEVTVTPSCASKSAGSCRSTQSNGTTVGKVSKPEISPSIAALNARQSPLAVLCKPGFFTKAQAQLLVQQFGLIECFRFTGEDQWVVIGNGYSQPSNPPSPGSTSRGAITAIVALEKCASSDQSCLNPSAVHNFADFRVYYAPSPLFSLGGLQATSYGNLLSIDDFGYCGPITFDLTNGHWYPESASKNLLETNPGSIQSLKVPPPTSGEKALTQKTPLATISTFSAC